MSVRFLALELGRWDQVKNGCDLVLSAFADERPLRGAAGLADWRMCGRLSSLLRHQRFSGAGGETLLIPPGRRLPFSRILVFGLGERRGYAEKRYLSDVRWIRDVVKKAGGTRYAVQPPGRAMGLIAARRALQIWIDEAGDAADEISIIDTPAAQKQMAEVLSGS
jgi:hypothetical protein